MTFQEDVKSACLGMMCLLQAALVGSAVAYVVFAIIFLVKDYSVCGDASPLWVFVLVTLCAPTFINYLRMQNQSPDSREADHVTPFAAGLLIICELVTGGTLIYGKGHVCENMKHTGLWIISLIMFWSILSAFFIVVVALIGTYLAGQVGSNVGTDTVVNLEDASNKI